MSAVRSRSTITIGARNSRRCWSGRRTRRSSGRDGARCGSPVSRRRRRSWPSGSRINATMRSGSTARWRWTIPASDVRSMPSTGKSIPYRDFLPRVLEHLQVPRKGLFGPWGHKYPQLADPGPGLDWVSEEVRWWTQWLLGVDTGIMREPMFRVFLEDRTAVEVWPKDVPGPVGHGALVAVAPHHRPHDVPEPGGPRGYGGHGNRAHLPVARDPRLDQARMVSVELKH